MKRPHAIFEVTIRTIQGRFLLKPSQQLNKLILGALGRALHMNPGMRIYGIKVMSNHIHILLSAPDHQTLSEFMTHFAGNVARIAGDHYGWRDRFWARRYTALAVEDRGSLIKSVRYLIVNCCKEGLVSSPLEWPGVGSERALAFGEKLEGTWYDNTAMGKARRKGRKVNPEDFATKYEIPLHPIPPLEGKDAKEVQAFYQELIRDVERQTVEMWRALEGKPLGPAGVLAQDPWDSPENFKRSPAPLCHASSRRTREKYRRRYKWFVALYRQATERLLSKQPEANFPEGGCLPAFLGSPTRGPTQAASPG